ncbi:MAG: tRNA (adenosine(37)-N6)-dimethylallyltransferase MiaA [Dehalococcoidia bacterium]|nr:tRNA (adenosine(37)-N6)-dimethylallyltransferase MiaA [Dehalococcoidia bacterium]
MKRLIAIVGPTASGKSGLATHLASIFNGEIVGADSRQIYQCVDIAVAKPTDEQRSSVPHHLIDIISPDSNFTLAQYQELAYQSIADIQRHDKLPFLVGGSGLYIWSVIEGWNIPHVPPNKELRHNLTERARCEGVQSLYNELLKVDPLGAQKINPQNLRRIIRALEVCELTGKPFSMLQGRTAPPFDTLIIGLTAERKDLYRRIDSRIDDMIKEGLVKETRNLLQKGYDLDLPAMTGLGYKQIAMFLNGEVALDTAIQQIKFETHRFVRHQYSWFRINDERIHWFDIMGQNEEAIIKLIDSFIA